MRLSTRISSMRILRFVHVLSLATTLIAFGALTSGCGDSGSSSGPQGQITEKQKTQQEDTRKLMEEQSAQNKTKKK